jgi:hypothetical protein
VSAGRHGERAVQWQRPAGAPTFSDLPCPPPFLGSSLNPPKQKVYARGAQSPLTEYYVWPRRDAWDELRVALESKPWITDRDRIVLLNRLTEVINYWQDAAGGGAGPAEGAAEQARPTLDDARSMFPDCSFAGALAMA